MWADRLLSKPPGSSPRMRSIWRLTRTVRLAYTSASARVEQAVVYVGVRCEIGGDCRRSWASIQPAAAWAAPTGARGRDCAARSGR